VLFVNARVRGAGWDALAAETACWQGDQLAAWRTTGDVSAIDGIDALYNAAKSANRASVRRQVVRLHLGYHDRQPGRDHRRLRRSRQAGPARRNARDGDHLRAKGESLHR
jgi:hypothetical protein